MRSQIGRYQLQSLLGSGAMGAVYLARDPDVGRLVAIKTLSSTLEPERRERFLREAQALASLKHPNVIQLLDYDAGNGGDEAYLVLEFVEGPTLFDLLDHGLMSEVTAMCVGHELALALEHIHARDVVHRDIKPENLMVEDGRVLLTDFGTVKAIGRRNLLEPGASKTRPMGTPGFMSPEQFAGDAVDARTDIFAFGATLYNLTTHRLPYDGGSAQGIYEQLKSGRLIDPRTNAPLLSEQFCRFLSRCLSPRPKRRFTTATELRMTIREILDEHGVTDVREEIRAFVASPAGTRVRQRERSVEHLLRELKLAIEDRELARATAVVERLRVLAPADPRLQAISGGALDGRPMERGVNWKRYQADRRRSAMLGVLIGAAIGATAVILGARVGWWSF